MNSQLRYSFVERPGDGSDRFQIEPATGQVASWTSDLIKNNDLMKGDLDGKFPRPGRRFLPIGGEHFFLSSPPTISAEAVLTIQPQVRATDQDGAGLSATHTLTVSLSTHYYY